MINWISTADRLPLKYETVLIVVYSHHITSAYLEPAQAGEGNNEVPYAFSDGPMYYFGHEVTHWAEILPELPYAESMKFWEAASETEKPEINQLSYRLTDGVE